MLQKVRLGQLLRERAYLDAKQLEAALSEQRQSQRKLGEILLKLGYITQVQLNEALAIQAGIECVKLTDLQVESACLSLVPAELASKHCVLPVMRVDGQLSVAMVDPFNCLALQELRTVTGMGIRRFWAEPKALEKAILKHYGSSVARMLDRLAPAEHIRKEEEQEDYSAAKLSELARQPSLVNLVNLILLEAIDARASDIHIEPFELMLKIKYRIDGMLVEKSPSPKRLQAAIVSRIKIMANMNIAERFVPQDGHIEFAGKRGKIDMRVSTVPTIFGESVTIRLLDRSAALIQLSELGMSSSNYASFQQCIQKPHGIILVTGPTGSGKTTTLYAALNNVYTPALKIITIEDPVEYQLNGVIQMPVNPKRGLTFATGLRHILRQDPDVVMVGEIRDSETAEIAIRAALTGHLVLSTLHTNDSAGAINRLIDMGVEPFLLASSLEAVIAQRIVRKICPACKEPHKPQEAIVRSVMGGNGEAAKAKFYHGAGCVECNGSGTRGRTGIFEVLRISDELRQMISSRQTNEDKIKRAATDFSSMRQDGVSKALAGVTSIEEVLRVTQSIETQ
jgi:type IV pilus assembly protein PilB